MKNHKILNIFVLFVLLLSTCGILASAFRVSVETEPVKPVTILDIAAAAMAAAQPQPEHIERCAFCPDGQVRQTDTYHGRWCLTYYLDCPHGDPSVKDRFELREATAIYTCDTCGCTRFQHLEQESRIYCTSKR